MLFFHVVGGFPVFFPGVEYVFRLFLVSILGFYACDMFKRMGISSFGCNIFVHFLRFGCRFFYRIRISAYLFIQFCLLHPRILYRRLNGFAFFKDCDVFLVAVLARNCSEASAMTVYARLGGWVFLDGLDKVFRIDLALSRAGGSTTAAPAIVRGPTNDLRTSLIFVPLNFPPIPATTRPESSSFTLLPFFPFPFGRTVIHLSSLASKEKKFISSPLQNREPRPGRCSGSSQARRAAPFSLRCDRTALPRGRTAFRSCPDGSCGCTCGRGRVSRCHR